MITISNDLYLTALGTLAGLGQKPIIGYHSIITLANLSASSSNTEKPIANLWNPDTDKLWESDTLDTGLTEYIYVDNTANESIDYFGIARHNLGTGSIEYTLQSSTDDTHWDDVAGPTTPADDRAIMEYFDARTDGFWRLKLVCTTDEPTIAHMKLGQALLLERPIFVGHEPETLSQRVKKETFGSESGQYLGQIITRRYQQGMVKQQHTTQAFIRNQLVPFIKHVNNNGDNTDVAQGPFFFAWRPADWPLELIYGWTNDTIQPTNQLSNGYMEYSFRIEGIA